MTNKFHVLESALEQMTYRINHKTCVNCTHHLARAH